MIIRFAIALFQDAHSWGQAGDLSHVYYSVSPGGTGRDSHAAKISMRAKFKIKVSTKTVTAEGLEPADAEAFRRLVPEGSFETTEVVAQGGGLPPKQRKELEAVRALMRTKEFSDLLTSFTGVAPAGEFELEILWDGDDPPDAVLVVADKPVRIEITDYPPDQASLLNAMSEMPGPAALPAFHEGGCNPEQIKKFMATPVSLVKPHFSSVADEAQALLHYAEGAVRKKDETRCTDWLLLHGPVAFSYPAEEVIDHIVRHREFVSIKAVAFVRSNGCRLWNTNLA